MTIQIPSSHVVSCCAPRETEQMQHEIKKIRNSIIPDT